MLKWIKPPDLMSIYFNLKLNKILWKTPLPLNCKPSQLGTCTWSTLRRASNQTFCWSKRWMVGSYNSIDTHRKYPNSCSYFLLKLFNKNLTLMSWTCSMSRKIKSRLFNLIHLSTRFKEVVRVWLKVYSSYTCLSNHSFLWA